MMHQQLSRWSAVLLGALVVFGIARAANSHYAERRSAFYESQQAERKRLGLTDWGQVKAKYPTPEITLCRAARVVPGATGEVTVHGKFVPGSKFLFENDIVEVVKESATATEYHATVRVPAGVGPGYSPLHVFAAVSGIEASPPCPAVYIGGKYEWEFSAQNGWRIKLHPKGDSFPKDGMEATPYTAEFYRGNETKPFEVRDFGLGLGGPLYGNSYSGGFAESSNQSGPTVDMEQIMKKLSDPNTSPEERERMAQRMVEAQQQMMDPANAMKAQQQQQQKDAEFGCKNMHFNDSADSVEGQISCGQKVGTISIKGSRRFVGP
jgi:hypothetical protein